MSERIYCLEEEVWDIREWPVIEVPETPPLPEAEFKSIGYSDPSLATGLTKNYNTGLWIRPTKEPTDINNWTVSGWWNQTDDVQLGQRTSSDIEAGSMDNISEFMYASGPAGMLIGNEGDRDKSGPGFCFYQDYYQMSGGDVWDEVNSGSYYTSSDWGGKGMVSGQKSGEFVRGFDLLVEERGIWRHLVLSVKNNIPSFYIDGVEIINSNSDTILDGDRTWNKKGESNILGLYMPYGDFFFTIIPKESWACQFHNIDGQALGPEEFRTADGKPKRYTGEFGNNGFYIPVQEGLLGTDQSGNGNHAELAEKASENDDHPGATSRTQRNSSTNRAEVAAWASRANLLTGRSGAAGCGTVDAGLCFGGLMVTNPRTEHYDGTSWSVGGNLPTARHSLAGCGSSTAALAFGGTLVQSGPTVTIATTEHYNGTSWSVGGQLVKKVYNHAGCGTVDAALSFGGSTKADCLTETYNGVSWSPGVELSVPRYGLAGCGTTTAALSFGGRDYGDWASTTEFYNGISWTYAGGMPGARTSLAGCGSSTAALAFGGSGWTADNTTSSYDGESWTVGGELIAGRDSLAGCGMNTAALNFGGEGDALLSNKMTEEYVVATPEPEPEPEEEPSGIETYLLEEDVWRIGAIEELGGGAPEAGGS